MPIELRRLLIGDTNGDFNFLRWLTETAAKLRQYSPEYDQPHDISHWWRGNYFGNFLGGVRSLHLRYLRVTYGGGDQGIVVSHYAPAFGCGAVARFGLGLASIVGGSFVLGDPNDRASINPNGPGYYELRWNQPAQAWRVSVAIGPSGGTQDLDEVRLWEFLDIEPYLDELIPSQSETEVFQMPHGRYFKGSHYRWEQKRLTVSLLVPRSETTFRRQLEALLTRPSPSFPLELFIDNYLFRCAPIGLSSEPVGGQLLRIVLELALLQPYGYFHTRRYAVTAETYPNTTVPITLSVNNAESDVEVPCEVRVYVGNAVNGYKIRVSVSPMQQQAVYVMDGTESGKVLSFQEDGRVLLASRGSATTVIDVTHRLETKSQLPLTLLPETNLVFLERLDNNNNPTSDTAYWQLACFFNPRIGEVIGL